MIPLNVARTDIFTLSAIFCLDTGQRHTTPPPPTFVLLLPPPPPPVLSLTQWTMQVPRAYS